MTYDCRGRSIELSDEAWKHVAFEHPDLVGYQSALRLAVERPYIMTREIDDSFNYYGARMLPARHAKYLHVLARVGGEEAEISIRTAWPANAVDQYEEALC
jgi:hypothetical protein